MSGEITVHERPQLDHPVLVVMLQGWIDASGAASSTMGVLEAETKPRTIAGWDLPAGIRVYPAIVVVQLREDLYPRPHEFRPERFIEEEATSYSWLPFGGGIRRCIGAALAQAEMAEVIRTVVSRVDLEPVRPGREHVVMRGITLVPRHGTPVQIRNRLVGGGERPRARSATSRA